MMSKSRIFILGFALLVGAVVVWKWPKSHLDLQHCTSQNSVLFAETKMQQEVVVHDEPSCYQTSAATQVVVKGMPSLSSDQELPQEVDLIAQLFNPFPPILPIVETVSFVSRVPWLPSRPAYLGDWAAHYETSKHFISRSLNGADNYMNENVSRGDRFNVFRKDKKIEFHLVVDLSRTKLWLYYYDVDEEKRQLLKSYLVCPGMVAEGKASGSLTPTGVYAIGREVACYNEESLGLYKNESCQMITTFGTRWIPLVREIAHCTGSCKGLGLHGVPWVKDLNSGRFIESRECIGTHSSLGCIRLLTEDIQEIFSIIISKPSYVHIVRDFQEAELPGKEV